MPEQRQSLGLAIRNRRIELGLTQEELAERIGDGVRQSDVSRLERDRIQLPRAHRLRAIAHALDLEPGEFLVRSGWEGAFSESHPPDEPEAAGRSPHPQSDAPVAAMRSVPQIAIGPSHQLNDSLRERLRHAITISQELRVHTAEVIQKSTQTATKWSGEKADDPPADSSSGEASP